MLSTYSTLHLLQRFIFLSLTLLCLQNAYADVRLPKIIGNNMVLQQNKPIKIWGFAEAGEKISIRFNERTQTAIAGKDGKWDVLFEAMTKGGPYQMVIQGKNTILVENILVGEVWLCSGQSNMEWPLDNSTNGEEEIKNAQFNEIRFFQVPKNIKFKPTDDLPEGEWKVVSPSTVAAFSAVAYHFGKNLYNKYKFPIGLIGSYWGGTDIETWMDSASIAPLSEFENTLKKLNTYDEETFRKEHEAKVHNIRRYLKSNTDGLVNGVAQWADPGLNEKDWEIMNVPGLWELNLLPDFDGVVWLRKTIVLTKEQIKNNATLYLGKIDDSDQSWVNGNFVGKTEQQYNLLRKYVVPVAYLKEGKNVITVRVEDTGGGGGIWGEKENVKLETSAGTIPLEGAWKFQVSPEKFSINYSNNKPNMFPTLLYNGMIAPLRNYTIQGVIWYQGENNESRAKMYETLFPRMITGWRTVFHDAALPFLFVQLPGFRSAELTAEESTWPALREAQTKALALPNVGMAIALDLGEADDIHPRNKKDIGYRLSLPARALVYRDTIVYSGPTFKSITNEKGTFQITFNHTRHGIVCRNKYGYVMGFEVAGADKKYYWAQAWIKDNKVYVTCDRVSSPLYVRYAWKDNPEDANLYNGDGLPAAPFRTK
jgi:sialate O-acetylesterase